MGNPPFWWYLPGKMGFSIFMGYVSFREGIYIPLKKVTFRLTKWQVGRLEFATIEAVHFVELLQKHLKIGQSGFVDWDLWQFEICGFSWMWSFSDRNRLDMIGSFRCPRESDEWFMAFVQPECDPCLLNDVWHILFGKNAWAIIVDRRLDTQSCNENKLL